MEGRGVKVNNNTLWDIVINNGAEQRKSHCIINIGIYLSTGKYLWKSVMR